MRSALVIFSLILSLGIGLALGRGKPSSAPANKGLVIGFAMDTLKEARWQTDRDLFVQQAESQGVKVLVQDAASSDAAQIQHVESFISQKVDAIVIVPHDGKAMAKAVKLAHEAGIPVISYDRLITDCDLDLYVTFDNIKVGEAQAQYLVDHLPTTGKGKIVRIYGAPTDNNAKLFKQGQDNILKPYIEHGDIKVIHEDWATDWQPKVAKDITNAAITKHGLTFDAILASNDGTAGGAIQALREEKSDRKILVTGQDADADACRRIAEGSQAMTIYKPIKELATRAADLAVSLAKRKPVVVNSSVHNGLIEVPAFLLKVIPVDATNLQDTVIKDGFTTYDSVYGNLPEEKRPAKR
jgi:D-xylose transport system substrate-binding protein